jgi:CRISPR type I-E-associated protein CasB/Cse2
LVDKLGELKPSELSRLRLGAGSPLGPDVEVYDTFRELFHTVRRAHPTAKWVCEFVVTLFPSHPEAGGQGDLGAALRRIRPRASEQESRERADQRFSRLLDCRERRALFTELSAAVRRLAQSDVPVDWAVLFDDLTRWYRPGHPTQEAWATSYFQD